MTMLTSLKALLFPTPAQAGVKGDAVPAEGSADFVQLLNTLGATAPAAAQPTAVAPNVTVDTDGEESQNNIEYQDFNLKTWHPALASATPSTPSLAPSPDTQKPYSPVQLAVALPDSETLPAAAISAPAPLVSAAATDVVEPGDFVLADDIPAEQVPAAAGKVEAAIPSPEQPQWDEAAASSPALAPVAPAAVEQRSAPLPVTLHQVRPHEAAPLDILVQSPSPETTYVPEAAIPSPERPQWDEAAPSSPALAPVAPAAVEQQPAPSPAKLRHVRPHEAAPLDILVQSPSAETGGASEPGALSTDDAKLVVQDDSQMSVQPTVTVMAPDVAPIAVSPATIPTETTKVAATLDAAPDTSDASVSIASPSLSNTPALPTPATPMGSFIASNYAAPAPAEAAPLSPVAEAPDASAPSPRSANSVTVSVDLPVTQPSIGKPAPDAARATSETAPAMAMQAASPLPTTASAPAVEAAAASPVAVAAAPMTETVETAAAIAAPAASEPAEVVDQPLDLAQDATPTAPAKPRAEAVSLLQLVRDHMSPRAPRRTETATPVSDATPAAATVNLSTAVNDSATPLMPVVQSTAQPLATVAPAIPTVDLSASLGAQLVDMGVSGQWIDGLARDIASLSANGAQGRFQINATELGPVEVNIRQGDDGAAISLTVASEAAEQALRQDGDRLKLDASLSAIRISEVKIERAPHVVEASRAEGSTNQNTAQQQSGGGNQNPGQAAGQNMGQSSAQSHMQGRGQQRENIAFGHKAGNDGAVLNHMDAGDTAGGAARARYA